MPDAMVTSINNLDDKGKTLLIFSCFGGNYVEDWNNIYEKTVKFVYDMYHARFRAYENINSFEIEVSI